MTDAQLYNFDLVNGEHKKDIVVLVVDLVNSSSLKSNADATTWRAQYTKCMPVILAVVTRYNGRVVKFLGDGFLFAFPPFERDPEDDALRAAVVIQRQFESLREEGEIDAKMQVRVSAGIVNASVVNWKVGVVEGGEDYVGEEVDAVFRLNSAIAANGIIINTAMNGDIKWRSMSRELGLISDDAGNPTKFLGRLSLKGLPPTPAYEVGWTSRFFGLSGSSNPAQTQGSPTVGAAHVPVPSNFTQTGAGSATVTSLAETTVVGHFYAFNAAGNSGWIQRHNSEKEQMICVFANIVRGGTPEMGEVVCFVAKPGVPHKKAMQVIRGGTTLQGEVRQVDGLVKVKVDEYAAREHGPFTVEMGGAKVKVGDRVEFVLHFVQEGGGTWRPIGKDGRVVVS